MIPNESYKYLVFVAIAILFVALGITFKVVGAHKDKSISEHIVANSLLCKIDGLVLIVCAILMLAYFHFWFIPLHDLPIISELLIVIGLFSQAFMAIVPDHGDNRKASRQHRLATYIMGLTIIGFLLVSGTSMLPDKTGLLLIGAGIVAAIHAALVQTHRSWWNNFLLHQSAFFIIFLSTIIITG